MNTRTVFAGLALLATCILPQAQAEPARVRADAAAVTYAFNADTLPEILARHAGKPFILSVWSANGCTYCLKELKLFGQLEREHPGLPLVFVSTDTPDFVPEMERLLTEHGLAAKPSYVFDDAIPERPRRAIDAKWRGELPRTYFYDAAHAREAVSGLVSEAKLRSWMAQHLD